MIIKLIHTPTLYLHDLFKQINATSKRTEKEQLLKDAISDNTTTYFSGYGTRYNVIKRYILACLDPNINYYVKDIPSDRPDVDHGIDLSAYMDPSNDSMCIMEAIDALRANLCSRVLTGYAALAFVFDVYGLLTDEGRVLLGNVLKRDLRCGVGIKTVNKAFGETVVYVPPYMRCSGFSKKNLSGLKLPVISQTKMDGSFINVIVKSTGVSALARSGEDVTRFLSRSVVDDLLTLNERYGDVVFMGESLVYNDDRTGFLPRELGNGYLNSNDIDPERVVFYFWDVVTVEEFNNAKSNTPYHERFSCVADLWYLNNPALKIVDSKICDSVDDIVKHFKEMRERNEEGTVIKGFDGVWKDGVSKEQIKVKVVFECDLKVSQFNLGEKGKQFENTLGTITMLTSDNLLTVNVGNGFSIEDRYYIWDHQEEFIDAIASVRANDVTVTKRDDNGNPIQYSLFLVRLNKFRHDKTEADDAERVIAQVNEFIDALKLLED